MTDGAHIVHPTCGKREINFPARLQKQCAHDESRYGTSAGVTFLESNQSGRPLNNMGTHQEETFYKSAMSYGEQT